MRPVHKTLLVTLFATAAAVPAFAQKPGDPLPNACEEVSKDRTDRAHETYKSGRLFLDEGQIDKAIQYFTDSYAIACNNPAILIKIADAWERKPNKAEALRHLEAFLERSKKDDPDRDTVRRRVENLRRELAAASSSVAPIPPPPASASSAAASSHPAVDKPPPHAPRTSMVPWIVVGAGGAALLTGGVLTALGAKQVSDADKRCDPATPGGRDCRNAQAVSDGNAGRTLATVGVVVGVVGALSVAGGLVWHFVDKPKGSERAVRWSPEVAPGYAGFTFVREF
jgi:hypothetical protein